MEHDDQPVDGIIYGIWTVHLFFNKNVGNRNGIDIVSNLTVSHTTAIYIIYIGKIMAIVVEHGISSGISGCTIFRQTYLSCKQLAQP